MNVCIVGYGAIGPVHASALLALDNVKVYAICDVNEERAKKGAEKFGAICYTSFDDALSDDKIDSFHICTPHYLHFDMVAKVLESGRWAVCEKPVVMTRGELSRALLEWKNKPAFCIFQNRTNTSIRFLENVIKNDESLGKLLGIKAVMTWHRDETYYKSGEWRGKKAKEGGGVVINQSIHTLDLVCYLGGRVKSVESSVSNHSLKGAIEVEDTAEAYLTFENGASAVFYATNASKFDSPPLLEVKFEHALFAYINEKLYRNGELVAEDAAATQGKACWGSGHERAFYDIYKNNSPLFISDVENTMNTVFDILEGAKGEI